MILFASSTPTTLWDDALTRGLRAPGFRLVRDGDTLPRASVTRAAGIGNETVSDVIQPNKVLELFDSGASVVLQGLHFTNPALARLANNLALDLDQPVQINAYLSPASARGLDLHFDFHDVLVVQLSGSKRWRVWDRPRPHGDAGARRPRHARSDARRGRRGEVRPHPRSR
ncbi:MAG: cupin domain-containing protein [Ilumatobacteraceae bacterium]